MKPHHKYVGLDVHNERNAVAIADAHTVQSPELTPTTLAHLFTNAAKPRLPFHGGLMVGEAPFGLVSCGPTSAGCTRNTTSCGPSLKSENNRTYNPITYIGLPPTGDDETA